MENRNRKPRRKGLLAIAAMMVIMTSIGCSSSPRADQYSAQWWAAQPAPQVELHYGSQGQLALSQASLGAGDSLGQAMASSNEYRYATNQAVQQMIAADNPTGRSLELRAPEGLPDTSVTATATGNNAPAGF